MKGILLTILSIAVFNVLISSRNSGDDSVKDVIPDTSYSNLPVLHLNGTPYENGFQHGKILKNRILKLIDLWKTDIEINYQMPADECIKIFPDSSEYIPAIGLVTIREALSAKPICNSNTFVSTIMEFNENYSELRISPGKPDSTEYLVFRIKK